MATLEATYTSINGSEANKIIKSEIGKKVDLMYLLKQANTFHRIHITGNIKVECYPKDVPVPEIEFDFMKETPEATAGNFNKEFIKIDELKAHRDKLIIALEKVNVTLSTVLPSEEINIDLDAGNKPDELRLDHNMPIPMIKRDGGSVTEVMVPAKDIQVAK